MTLLQENIRLMGMELILFWAQGQVHANVCSILKHFEILQVSPASTSGFLSVSSDYPYFSRPIPSSEMLSDAIIKYAKYKIGWDRGVIVSSSDPNSLFAATSINAAAAQNNFIISKWEIFQSNTIDMSIQLKSVISVGARLIIFCGHPTNLEVFVRDLYREILLRGDVTGICCNLLI